MDALNLDATGKSTDDSAKSSNSRSKNLFNSDFSFLTRAKFVRRKPKTERTEAENVSESSVNVKIYSLRLNHLFKPQNKHVKTLIRQELQLKRIRDLVHSLSALYDRCLPDIGSSSVYDCICAPKAFTICIFKDSEEAGLRDEIVDEKESLYGSNDCLETVEEEHQEPGSIFADIFSDMDGESETESSESTDSSSDDDEDFTIGLNTYLQQNSKSFGLKVQ
jgi:hypothetical protein